MPSLSPQARMRLSGQKAEQAITQPRLTAEQKEQRKKEKEAASESPVAPWIVALLLFIVVGSSIFQIFLSIQNSPSMSQEH